jgi:hypothetical protein
LLALNPIGDPLKGFVDIHKGLLTVRQRQMGQVNIHGKTRQVPEWVASLKKATIPR